MTDKSGELTSCTLADILSFHFFMTGQFLFFSETVPNFSIEKSIEIYRKSRIRDLICIEFSIDKLGSVSEKKYKLTNISVGTSPSSLRIFK